MDWQPIETAPRDGTDILVVFRDNPSVQLVVSREDGSKYPWHTLDGPSYYTAAFSHWMPLPPPPMNQGGE